MVGVFFKTGRKSVFLLTSEGYGITAENPEMSTSFFFRDKVFLRMGGIYCFAFCISDNITSSPGFAIGNLRNIVNKVFPS